MHDDADPFDPDGVDADGVPDLGNLAPHVVYPPPLPPGIVEHRREVEGIPVIRRVPLSGEVRPPSMTESLGPARIARILDEVARGVRCQPARRA